MIYISFKQLVEPANITTEPCDSFPRIGKFRVGSCRCSTEHTTAKISASDVRVSQNQKPTHAIESRNTRQGLTPAMHTTTTTANQPVTRQKVRGPLTLPTNQRQSRKKRTVVFAKPTSTPPLSSPVDLHHPNIHRVADLDQIPRRRGGRRVGHVGHVQQPLLVAQQLHQAAVLVHRLHRALEDVPLLCSIGWHQHHITPARVDSFVPKSQAHPSKGGKSAAAGRSIDIRRTQKCMHPAVRCVFRRFACFDYLEQQSCTFECDW